MAEREKDLVFEKLNRSAAIGIDSSHVADIVPVGFQPVNRCDLLSKKAILVAGVKTDPVAGGDGPVIADLVGPAIAFVSGPTVQAVTAPTIVGVPGGVRCLKNNVVQRPVVADNEG